MVLYDPLWRLEGCTEMNGYAVYITEQAFLKERLQIHPIRAGCRCDHDRFGICQTHCFNCLKRKVIILIHIGLRDQPDDEMLARLRNLPQVKDVVHRDHALAFETRDAQRALLAIIDLLNETDTAMTSLEILEPNLESVFIQLTGKQLRD